VKLSFFLAAVASVVLCFGPTVATLGPNGSDRVSLLENQGWGVMITLAIPVLLAALPLAPLPARLKAAARVVSAALLLCFVALGVLTVGIFYVPSAALMIIAAVQDRAGWMLEQKTARRP